MPALCSSRVPCSVWKRQQARCWDTPGGCSIKPHWYQISGFTTPSLTLFLRWMSIQKDQSALLIWRNFYTLAIFWEFNMCSGRAIGRLERKHCVLKRKAANWTTPMRQPHAVELLPWIFKHGQDTEQLPSSFTAQRSQSLTSYSLSHHSFNLVSVNSRVDFGQTAILLKYSRS